MAAVLLFLDRAVALSAHRGVGHGADRRRCRALRCAALLRIWRVSGAECGLALITMVDVIWLDVLHGVLLAVGLALVLLIRRASRPQDFELGHVPGMRG